LGDYTTRVSSRIKTIIEDSSADIRIASSNGDPAVVGGRFDGGGHQTIDFDDLDELDQGKGFTKESIVIHETVEAYEGRNTTRGTPLTPPLHITAIDYENDVRISQWKPLRVANSPVEGFVQEANGDITATVDFTTHVARITIDGRTGDIKKVDVDRIP